MRRDCIIRPFNARITDSFKVKFHRDLQYVSRACIAFRFLFLPEKPYLPGFIIFESALSDFSSTTAALIFYCSYTRHFKKVSSFFPHLQVIPRKSSAGLSSSLKILSDVQIRNNYS